MIGDFQYVLDRIDHERDYLKSLVDPENLLVKDPTVFRDLDYAMRSTFLNVGTFGESQSLFKENNSCKTIITNFIQATYGVLLSIAQSATVELSKLNASSDKPDFRKKVRKIAREYLSKLYPVQETIEKHPRLFALATIMTLFIAHNRAIENDLRNLDLLVGQAGNSQNCFGSQFWPSKNNQFNNVNSYNNASLWDPTINGVIEDVYKFKGRIINDNMLIPKNGGILYGEPKIPRLFSVNSNYCMTSELIQDPNDQEKKIGCYIDSLFSNGNIPVHNPIAPIKTLNPLLFADWVDHQISDQTGFPGFLRGLRILAEETLEIFPFVNLEINIPYVPITEPDIDIRYDSENFILNTDKIGNNIQADDNLQHTYFADNSDQRNQFERCEFYTYTNIPFINHANALQRAAEIYNINELHEKAVVYPLRCAYENKIKYTDWIIKPNLIFVNNAFNYVRGVFDNNIQKINCTRLLQPLKTSTYVNENVKYTSVDQFYIDGLNNLYFNNDPDAYATIKYMVKYPIVPDIRDYTGITTSFDLDSFLPAVDVGFATKQKIEARKLPMIRVPNENPMTYTELITRLITVRDIRNSVDYYGPTKQQIISIFVKKNINKMYDYIMHEWDPKLQQIPFLGSSMFFPGNCRNSEGDSTNNAHFGHCMYQNCINITNNCPLLRGRLNKKEGSTEIFGILSNINTNSVFDFHETIRNMGFVILRMVDEDEMVKIGGSGDLLRTYIKNNIWTLLARAYAAHLIRFWKDCCFVENQYVTPERMRRSVESGNPLDMADPKIYAEIMKINFGMIMGGLLSYQGIENKEARLAYDASLRRLRISNVDTINMIGETVKLVENSNYMESDSDHGCHRSLSFDHFRSFDSTDIGTPMVQAQVLANMTNDEAREFFTSRAIIGIYDKKLLPSFINSDQTDNRCYEDMMYIFEKENLGHHGHIISKEEARNNEFKLLVDYALMYAIDSGCLYALACRSVSNMSDSKKLFNTNQERILNNTGGTWFTESIKFRAHVDEAKEFCSIAQNRLGELIIRNYYTPEHAVFTAARVIISMFVHSDALPECGFLGQLLSDYNYMCPSEPVHPDRMLNALSHYIGMCSYGVNSGSHVFLKATPEGNGIFSSSAQIMLSQDKIHNPNMRIVLDGPLIEFASETDSFSKEDRFIRSIADPGFISARVTPSVYVEGGRKIVEHEDIREAEPLDENLLQPGVLQTSEKIYNLDDWPDIPANAAGHVNNFYGNAFFDEETFWSFVKQNAAFPDIRNAPMKPYITDFYEVYRTMYRALKSPRGSNSLRYLHDNFRAPWNRFTNLMLWMLGDTAVPTEISRMRYESSSLFAMQIPYVGGGSILEKTQLLTKAYDKGYELVRYMRDRVHTTFASFVSWMMRNIA